MANDAQGWNDGRPTGAAAGTSSAMGRGGVVLVAVVALLGGCTQFGPAEKELLIQANQQYAQGDVSGATGRLNRLIKDYGQAGEIGEAYYLRGLCRVRAGQAEAARSDFEEALSKSRRDDLTARAQASLGTLAYERGQWTEAADRFAKAIPGLPNQPPKDEVLFSAAMANQRAGSWRQGKAYLAELLRNFHDRPIAAEARRLASWRHECYAIQLAAYQSSDNAQEAVKSWRRKGLDPDLENVPRGGAAIWIIKVGRYRTYAEASNALAAMRRLEPKAIIVP
ncbi:MAG TPA: SPOR domain-containing protein [Phycisphaerae bacterium]|nr:SPOR domain-containing protein [Phycisphaerae bacterium]